MGQDKVDRLEHTGPVHVLARGRETLVSMPQ